MRSAREFLAGLLDDRVELTAPVVSDDPLRWPRYPDQLQQAAIATGLDEAVVVARGRIAGSLVEAVVAVWEFGFLAGSMGVAVGERLARAYEAARNLALPIVLLPATGGARIQEGMPALAQMAKTTVAARAHADAGLLQVAVLRDPTTGGVFASHVNLADVLLAETGGRIGFAGPRVAEAMTGGRLPAGSHTAEAARAAGLVDEVVRIGDLHRRLAALLAWPGHAHGRAVVVDPSPTGSSSTTGPLPVAGHPTPDLDQRQRPPSDARAEPRTPPADGWTELQRARTHGRARAGDYLRAFDVAFELRGDRAGGEDPAVRVALAWIAGRPAVVVSQDRHGNSGWVTPAGFRKAWRGLRLADRLNVPLVALIDTPGADASAASEAGGVAYHIARTMDELLAVRSPTVSVVIGEGGAGGALCLAVADRLLIQEHAVFSVIAPEGAAALLHRDQSRAAELAELLRPTAADLLAFGLADEVVAEPTDGEVAAVQAAIHRHLDHLAALPDGERLTARRRRWREAGGSGRPREVSP